MKKNDILAKQEEYLWPNHLLYYTDPLPLERFFPKLIFSKTL